MTTMITVQPVGWEGTWHENPAPQWIIPLSGRWYVESMDGTRIEMGRARFRSARTRAAARWNGKTGHKSGTVGDAPAVLMGCSSTPSANAPRPAGSGEPMDGFEIHDPRFRRYVLDNAGLEEIAAGFRWVEGPSGWATGTACCFRTCRETARCAGASGRPIDLPRALGLRQRADPRPRGATDRLLASRSMPVSHRARRARHAAHRSPRGQAAECAQRRDREIGRHDLVHRPALRHFQRLRGRPAGIRAAAGPLPLRPRDRRHPRRGGDFDGPNGLAFSPDERRLYVSETGDQSRPDPRQYIRVFDVGADGTLNGGDIFHKIAPGYCDGMKVDEDGNVWSSAADGVHCLSPEGRLLGKVRVPYRVSNLTWGGVHRNRLFIAASGSACSRSSSTAAAPRCRGPGDDRLADRRDPLALPGPGGHPAFYTAAFGASLAARRRARSTDDSTRARLRPWGRARALQRHRLPALRPRRRGHGGCLRASLRGARLDANLAAGPERLPARSGGVSAFKFRDPDGHPLELLAFPPEAVPPIWRDRPACSSESTTRRSRSPTLSAPSPSMPASGSGSRAGD